MLRSSKSALFLIAACTVSAAAQAHTGHGSQSLMQGLVHPFGIDHLLAMLAVGLWSVSALRDSQAWQGPATFMLALLAGALMAGSGTGMATVLPYLEQALALSVTLLGLLLLASRHIPRPLGLAVIAVAAVLHGAGHGAEAPAIGGAGYAAGFLLSTAALHLGGVATGLAIRRLWADRRAAMVGGLGALMGASGLYLLSQI